MKPTASEVATANSRQHKARGAKAPPAPPPVEVTDYASAMRSMIDRPFLKSIKYGEQQMRADREGAHPDVLEFSRVMVKRLAKDGIPVFASEIIRSGARQNALYVQGHSKAKAGQSPHQYGCAVDLIHSVKGWDLHPKAWDCIGHIGKEVIKAKGLCLVSFAWGGDWKFYDPAHWEVRDWQLLKERMPWPSSLKGMIWTPESGWTPLPDGTRS